MLDLLKEHWLALTSLVVALIGGVPGILSVWKEWKARPRIAAYLRGVSLILEKDLAGNEIPALILYLSIGNAGKEAVVPLAYQFESKIGNKWVRFDAGAVPEGAAYITPGEIDLRQMHAITRESPAVGFLPFATRAITYEELQRVYVRMPKRLICVDLFQRRHKIDLKDDLQPSGSPPATGPRRSLPVERY